MACDLIIETSIEVDVPRSSVEQIGTRPPRFAFVIIQLLAGSPRIPVVDFGAREHHLRPKSPRSSCAFLADFVSRQRAATYNCYQHDLPDSVVRFVHARAR